MIPLLSTEPTRTSSGTRVKSIENSHMGCASASLRQASLLSIETEVIAAASAVDSTLVSGRRTVSRPLRLCRPYCEPGSRSVDQVAEVSPGLPVQVTSPGFGDPGS